ncbi:MAG: diaminopimelate decarboxylase family protein [Candidatus Dormibacteria bacterium]
MAEDSQLLGATDAHLLALAADRFGTPCYVTDLRELDRCAAELELAFPQPWVRQYSLKANPLPALVARLARGGAGANVVSAGEWAAARAAGVPNRLISLEGIGKTDAELQAAVDAAAAGDPLRWLTVESSDEMEALGHMAHACGLGESGAPVDVLLRLNPAVIPETRADFRVGALASKFGMPEAELRRLIVADVTRRSGLRVRGVHVHVGSQLQGTAAWAMAAVSACRLVTEMSMLDDALDTVDLGGGFPASAPQALAPLAFRADLDRRLVQAEVALPRNAAVEPGRYLVASAGWLVARVLHVRHREPLPQVVIDASMAELIRPALYGARHELLPLEVAGGSAGAWVPTQVEGAVCESTDTFGTHHLPLLSRGDLVVLAQTGAYGSSMFSPYNGRPRPPEILIERDGSVSLARPLGAFSP